MLSRISKALDRKVHRTRFQNVLQKMDESDPISQLLPEASHDEAPFSGSLNVSMKWKEKIVDVSLCDEASSDLPKTSEAPRCDEAPSSSSSSSGLIISKFDLISSIRKDLGKVEDFNLDDLIHLLLKLRDMENHQKASSLGPGLQKTKEIVSKQDIRRSVQTFLKQIGSAHVATVGLLVVARSLERFYPISTNREKCWHLLKEMYDLAIVLKRLRESAEGMQDVMQEATSLIIEGALLCSTQIVRSAFSRFFSTSPLEFEGALSNIRQKLNAMYMKINTEIALRGLTLIEHQGRSPLSKEYPTRAGNGQVEKDLLLTVEEDVPELEDEDIPELEDEDMPALEDAYMPELEEAYIHTPQVEEEPQKAYIRFVCLIIMYPVVYNAIFWKFFQWAFLVKIWQQFIGISSLIASFCTITVSHWFSRVLNPNIQLKNHFNGQVDEDRLSNGCQKVFKMETLVAATKNFHEDNKVGEGGFGAVYKGTHDGKQIAVKKMSFTDERSREDMKKQFKNEKLLAEFQHRNIVNLLGSCEQESQGFLVYEYLPNGSLDKFLFDPENRKLLDWHKRDNIIQGIAQGLQYLHEDSRVRIVHRDIKASNILLDEKLNPKIADFGTANIFPEDRTHVTATSAAGTFGYMALEYFMTREFTVKTDVYSFGIVLLELLTGEKISSNALESLGRVWRLYNRKEALQTIDPTIIETSDKEAAKALRCIQVGFLCIQHDRRRRPTMSQVIVMLSTDQSLPDPENPPCLPSYCATQENGNSAMEKLMFNSE